MSPRPVRVGILGRGFGQKVVAGAFEATPGAEVVDVVSPRDEAAVAALCARRDLDLVSVHSPPFLHLDHVRRAIEGGHAVLCDKPFGRDVAEAEEMCRLAEEGGVVNLVNFEMRFDPGRSHLRHLVRSGAVGAPAHVRTTHVLSAWRHPLRPYGWQFDDDAGGGWLRSMGSHQIDFVHWTFGAVVAGGASFQTAIVERPDGAGEPRRCTADDGFAATLTLEGGTTAVIESTATAAANLIPELLVVGDDAVLQVVGERRIVRHTADGAEEVWSSDDAAGLAGSMSAYAAVACEAVRDGAPPADAPTFADGLAWARVLERLRRSRPAG